MKPRPIEAVVEELLDRVIRMETRQVRLLAHFGLDPFVHKERKMPHVPRAKIVINEPN